MSEICVEVENRRCNNPQVIALPTDWTKLVELAGKKAPPDDLVDIFATSDGTGICTHAGCDRRTAEAQLSEEVTALAYAKKVHIGKPSAVQTAR